MLKALRRSRHAARFAHHLQRIERSLRMREEHDAAGRQDMVLALNYELVSDATRAIEALRRLEELTPDHEFSLEEKDDLLATRAMLSKLLELPAIPAWRVTGRSTEPGHASLEEIEQLYRQFKREAPTSPSDTPDWSGALRELRLLAEAGDATAQFKVGLIYFNGSGAPKNEAEAAKWWLRAAEQGHSEAQFFIAGMFSRGQGVAHDESKATHWFRLSAEGGNPAAQHNLAWRHYEGRVLQRDYSLAVGLWRQAAAQGFALAQFHLGLMFARGHGVQGDLERARYWFDRAAVGTPLTPNQLIEVRKHFPRWSPPT